MASALTPAERIRRGRQYAAAAWEIANQVTGDTPGQERGRLIVRTRSQAHQAISAVNILRRVTKPHFTAADRNEAERIIRSAHLALQHARRFSE